MKVVTVKDFWPASALIALRCHLYFHSFSKCLPGTNYVSGVAPGTRHGVMNKMVRDCEGSEVLPCLQANKLGCPAYRGWQKSGDSWARDRRFYSSQHSGYNMHPEFHIHIGPPCRTSP